MIKFKKMTTFAKVGAVAAVTSATGVVFIPVINEFIDNPKTKVHVFEFNNRLFKTKAAAEDARKKFTAMSGLIKAMKSDGQASMDIDFKPLMAEFVSFVSKLFAVKVFEMDDASTKTDHFKYDGMSEQQKKDILKNELNGQIKYGDLKDITSLVKYATAHKDENGWMFTPVDELLLSILGDGSGQGYSLNEIEYVKLSNKIEKIKASYEDYYSKHILNNPEANKFGGLEYVLVNGMVHHSDSELQMATKAKVDGINEGDASGDEYDAAFIANYQKWGTLKATLEKSKIDLNSYISDKNIVPAMRPVLLKLIAENAVEGWNNKERYSDDEIELRDLLAKVSSQNNLLTAQTIPGDHKDTSTNIVEGWNWSETGDGSDKSYADWQLELAKDIQDRQKLLDMHMPQAPDGALLGMNTAPTGDGTGATYDQSVFDLKQQFEFASSKIAILTTEVNLAVSSNTVAAPLAGIVSASGEHVDALGLGDGKDHSQSWAYYNQLKQLQQALKEAQTAKTALDTQISQTMVDTNTDGTSGGTSVHEHASTLLNIIDFDIAKQGWNYNKNYNEDQVNYAKALDEKANLEQQIRILEEDKSVIAAPATAVEENLRARGDGSDLYYAKEQIQLRDLKKQLANLGVTIAAEKATVGLIAAPKDGVLNPVDETKHEEMRGKGNGEYYSVAFLNAARSYRTYLAKLQSIQKTISDIVIKYPGLKDPTTGVSFDDLQKKYAVEGENTEERFSVEEVQYSKDYDSLELFSKKLTDATSALSVLGDAVSSDKHKAKLIEDVDKGVTPELDTNEKPSGDKTGNRYGDDDVAFRDALKLLKDTFKDGNPWWTTTKDKKSDEAYFALYNDWRTAIGKHTETTNAEKVGDGTDHKFESNRFKTFDAYFRKAIQRLHGDDQADAAKVSSEFDTILEYVQKHGSFTMKNGVITLSETEQAKDEADRSTGDGSDHTYLKMDTIHYNWLKTIGYSTSYKVKYEEAKTAFDKYMTEYNDGTLLSDAQKEKTATNLLLDAYNAKLKILEDAYDKANQGAKDKDKEYNDQKRLMEDLKKSGHPLHGYSDSDIKKIAALVDSENKAGTLSDDDKAKLKELDDITKEITTENRVLIHKNNAVSKLQTGEFYIRFTQQTEHFAVLGKNYAPSGDKSDNTYSNDQITGRNLVDKLKEAISNNHLTGKAASDELLKLYDLKENSRQGENKNTASGHPFGDRSGKTWSQWEVDLLSTVKSINEIAGRTHGKDKFAPEKAEEGKNYSGVGDWSENTYDSDKDKEFFNKFVPAYKKALQEQKDEKDKIQDLKTRKTAIEKLHINSDFDKDSDKYYVTSAGDAYSKDAIKAAKEWVTANTLKAKLYTENKDLANAKSRANTAKNDFEDEQQVKDWNKLISDDNKVIAKYSSSNKAKQISDLAKIKKTYDDGVATMRTWWNDNKGKYLDTSKTNRNFGSQKVNDNFDDFIAKDHRHEDGSMDKMYTTLTGAGANRNGEKNTHGGGMHTAEEFALRDALVNIITPLKGHDEKDISKYTAAFNSLFIMFKKSVDEKSWEKPRNYLDPYNYDDSHHRNKHNYYSNSHTDKFGGTYYTSVPLKDHSAAAMDNFKMWIMQYLKGDTERENKEAKGDGTNNKYNSNFFDYNQGKIDSTDKLDQHGFKLGQAAFKVSVFHSSVKRMTDDSKAGFNLVGSGDGSGNKYTAADIAYYNALKIAKEAQSDKDKQQKIVDDEAPKDGSIPRHTPVGFTGVGYPSHSQLRGDGSGNNYDAQMIEDMKSYYAQKNRLKDETKLMDDLEKDWESKVLPDKRSWDEVKTISEEAKTGDNHGVYWSKAEMNYNGDKVENTKLLGDIAKLQSQMIADPNAPKGTGTVAPQIKVVAAPERALEGYNNKDKGLGDNSKYSSEEIAKRDELSRLRGDLAVEEAKIKVFKDKGTVVAPSKNIVPVKMENWHPETIGDGSDKFYSRTLFDDRFELKAATAVLVARQQELNAFKASVGVDALKTIQTEVKAGMVDGVNNEVRYSIEEIALRDNRVKLGDENSILKSIKADANYGIYLQLTEDSELGENKKARGLGNNINYAKEQLDLREIENKIKSEETLHGINSEDDLVSYFDIFKQENVDTKTRTVDYYLNIDLNKAIEGDNRAAHGDESNALYTSSDIKTFNDIVALQTAIAKNEDRIKVLRDNGVDVAPADGTAITASESAKYKGQHKYAVGDESGNTYDQDYLDEAAEYKRLLDEYTDAKTAFDTFVNADPNQVKFFELKSKVYKLANNGKEWDPIAGVNWSDSSFDFKELFDEREALGVGRTMIDSNADAVSQFGVNNGHLGTGQTKRDAVVIYKGDGSNIEDQLQGSDEARIAYVLKNNGKVTDDSIVLDSLDRVAEYLQDHLELAPDGVIEKFASLQDMGIADTSDLYKIEEEIVSKDRFNSMSQNFEWGDQ